jgi:hypothetical protein
MSTNNSMTRALGRRSVRAGAIVAGAAAIGIGALAAPASAATHDWTGVAQCESGGNWSTNTGNGFFGGLQFTPSTWMANGGGAFASRPDLASSAEQIAVAEKVLQTQGVGAWPTCGRHLQGGTTAAAPVAAPAPAPAPAPAHAPAPAAAQAHAPAARAAAPSGGTYTVRAGDTLAKIAQAQKVSGDWRALWAANRGTVPNPNVIRVGQHLQL